MTPVRPAITPRDPDASPPALWEEAKILVCWLVSLFGEPVGIAALGVLCPRERREMLDWLRPLEALVRALLVIAAAALPVAAGPVRVRRSPAKPRTRRFVEQDPEQSTKWRVHFRAIPAPSGLPSIRRDRTRGPDLPSAWPIAERVEAVLRVIEQPEAYARRLAARLRKRPKLVGRCLTPPATDRPASWALGEARAQAVTAAAHFDTS